LLLLSLFLWALLPLKRQRFLLLEIRSSHRSPLHNHIRL
jgi:hypothetical protein